jgi:hypothetical protein
MEWLDDYENEWKCFDGLDVDYLGCYEVEDDDTEETEQE